MKRYKYIHVLWSGGAHFNKIIVNLINDEENCFTIDEHLFVTPYKHIYDEICGFPNIIFERDIKPQSAKLINKYSEFGDWIFLHGMCPTSEALKIKHKNRKKIVWRTWGHDAGGFSYKKGDFIKNIVKFILNTLWRMEVKSFKLIGVANAVDEIELKKKFGRIKTARIHYPAKGNVELYSSIKDKMICGQRPLNILIGHSGIDTDNHFCVIDKIKKYCNEDVCFIFVLSYGDKKYIEEVRAYARENCNGKYKFILEPMPIEKYAKMLAEIDIAIFDGKNSYALGNVSILLFFGKKLFLNSHGALAEAFRLENIPFSCTSDIDDMDFLEFSKKINYENIEDVSLMPTPYKVAVNRWKTMLKSL